MQSEQKQENWQVHIEGVTEKIAFRLNIPRCR
jgi:hypothetical protein